MRNPLWNSFDIVKDLVAKDDFKTVAEKVDLALNASMEAVADVLPTAAAPVLRQGVEAAAGALSTLRSRIRADRLSPDYVAGRLAAALDIMGYAASATADEDAIKKAKQQPFARILDMLAAKSLRNTEIAAALGQDKGYISRLLDELRAMEMVTSHRHGRDLYNALTPVGRLVVDEGVETARRAPLAQSKIVNLGFSLDNRPTPPDVRTAEVPRISATG
ncbi:helix-turn-helix domain-containing protein [Rhizobium sp. X9]|uniref:helix-turn-helix domain-containing protein n=1 Tax=Rhizobium sp. X9 TaxID=2815360 RepID=UPI001C0DD4B9|nr:helix-turn-helix domain-containing protein [Rhizobium sp. X9]